MTVRRGASALTAAFFLTVGVLGSASPASASGSIVTTIAGNGTAGNSGDGGPATGAQLNTPAGVAFDAQGDIYVADEYSNVVREISPSGVITTAAGTGTAGYSGDGGLASSAQLSGPTDVAIGPQGTLYIADQGNHVIRAVDSSGVIETVATTPSNPTMWPAGLDVDTAGNIYIADYFGCAVYEISAAGDLTTVAGTPGSCGYSGDGGPATSAQLNYPGDVVSIGGQLYIADSRNSRIRAVSPSGTITTVAGNGTAGNSGDGGPAVDASVSFPIGLATDSAGDMLIADYGTGTIREIDPAGIISTVAGTGTAGYSGDGGDAMAATFRYPARVNLDPSGDLYVSDYGNHVIRKIAMLGSAAVAPQPPTGVTANPGDASATVSWAPPTDDGGAPITGYDVTAHHGGVADTPVAVDGATTSVLMPALTNGTAYTFTVTATNSAGTSLDSTPSPAVTPAARPDAPTGVTATPADAQATVSWSAPASDGGAALTGYDVTPHHGGVADSPVAVDGSTTSTTVTGLTNGTAYTFTVTATNRAGTSPDSSPSSAVTPTGPPAAPTGVGATAGVGQATVSWSAPDDGGAPITGYAVTPHHGGVADAPVTVGGSTTSTTVTGLTNGRSYTFTVTATNSRGSSPDSAASDSVTPATVPDAPTGVTATAGDGDATVSWSAPADDGGAPVTGYDVTPHHGGVADRPVAVDGSSTGATITGLANGTAYTFTVTATNSAGTSAPSTPSAAATPVAPPPTVVAPGAPSHVTATGGDGQLTVTWAPPSSDGGAAVTSYQVTTHHDGVTDAPVTVDGSKTTLTLTDLTNGTLYTVTVTATNPAGSSPDSAPSTAVAPTAAVTVPSQPTAVTATAASHRVTVSWTPPAHDGGAPVTGYLVTAHHDGVTDAPVAVAGGATTAAITGLHNGTAYTFTVVAVNSAGTSLDSDPSAAVTPHRAGSDTTAGGPRHHGGNSAGGSGSNGGSNGQSPSSPDSGGQQGDNPPSASGPDQAPAPTPTAAGQPGTVAMAPFGAAGAAAGPNGAAAHHAHRHHHHRGNAAHRSTGLAGGTVATGPATVASGGQDRSGRAAAVHHDRSVWSVANVAAVVVAKNTAVPFALLIMVGLFLLVQNQMDRRDPKLALAPVYADPGVTFVPAMS